MGCVARRFDGRGKVVISGGEGRGGKVGRGREVDSCLAI